MIFPLTHSHTMTPFDAPGNKPFENTVGKGEIARNEQFLLFPQCFLPAWITFFHFRKILNCRLVMVKQTHLSLTKQTQVSMTLWKKPFENIVGKGKQPCLMNKVCNKETNE